MEHTRRGYHRWAEQSFCAARFALISLVIAAVEVGCHENAPSAPPPDMQSAEQEAEPPTQPEVVFCPPIKPQPQEKSMWCWAACINVILRSAGIPSTQEQIVRQVRGNVDNVTMQVPEIEQVFNNSVTSVSYVSGKPTRSSIRAFFASGPPGTRRLVIERRRTANWDWSEEWHAVLAWGYEIWPDGHLYVYLYDPEYDQQGRIDFGDDERWQGTFYVKVNTKDGTGHEQPHVAGAVDPDAIPDRNGPGTVKPGEAN